MLLDNGNKEAVFDVSEELKEPLAQNRLLIISVCNSIRQSKVAAIPRNRYVCL